MDNSTLPRGVINPFSDKFLEMWNLWKEFRLEFDKFRYKGCISEQMAIKKIWELSDKHEETAIKIIEQSIANSWTGFYQLKSIKVNAKQQPANSPQSARESLNSLYNQRFGNG